MENGSVGAKEGGLCGAGEGLPFLSAPRSGCCSMGSAFHIASCQRSSLVLLWGP